MKINGFISTIMLTGLLLITILGGITHAQDEVDWMPDENLRLSVRIQLGLNENEDLTKEMMRSLTGLDGFKQGISDLTGLEHAPSIVWLILGGNEISDIIPLASLKHLESLWIGDNPISDFSPLSGLTNLKELGLGECGVSNIGFLRNLTKLEFLVLHFNQIKDIAPLANLMDLQKLWLTGNEIEDIMPLGKLSMLRDLRLDSNFIVDFSVLEGLSVENLEYDEFCDFPRSSIVERAFNRNHPSIFGAWSSIMNRPHLTESERLARHDLLWSPEFGLRFLKMEEGIVLGGNLIEARRERDKLVSENPNMIFIAELRMRGGDPDSYFYRDIYGEDFPWIRDVDGSKVSGSDLYRTYLIDFTDPRAQDIIVQQAGAVYQCGLFDGIFFDFWNEGGVILEGHRTNEAEQAARETILKRIRAAVGDDFLIIVNDTGTPKRAAPYINGLFMESFRMDWENYTGGGLKGLEDILTWASENLQSPQVTCFEIEGIEEENPDSENNRRSMRLMTVLNLIHSDGYLVYTMGVQNLEHIHEWNESTVHHQEWHDAGGAHDHHHEHYWYDFWDAELGRPVGEKGLLYNGTAGLFIREFENGWVVYSRSGRPQTISLPIETTGVHSGLRNTQHVLADLDGEIYLKSKTRLETPPTADVNGDGVVNVLDLVIVANAIGKAAPDINGDGIVNVLDLVVIANAF